MSAPSEWIYTLLFIQKRLYQIGGSLLMGTGTVSCTVNALVFSQKALRKNSCAMCFLAFNIASLLLLYLSLLPVILQIGFDIEPGAYNLVYCRIRYYLGFLLACLPPFYLILASIDRWLFTAAHAQMRGWSNSAVIGRCLGGITAFWMLFHTHALVYTDILEYGPYTRLCYFHPGLYSMLVSYYTLSVNGIIPLALLCLFGALTVKHVRARGTHPVVNTLSKIQTGSVVHRRVVARTKDQQLIRMLLVEILTCVTFNFVHPSVLLYVQITQHQVKSYETTIIEQLAISVSTLGVYIPFCTSLYTNLIVSRTFRNEIKRMLSFTQHATPVRPM